MKHAMIVVTALAVLSGAAQIAAAADGKEIFDKNCGTCHNKGMMGAPKIGDKAAWAPLIKGGEAALDEAALKGKGKMPAKGGHSALTADDIKAANAYIIKQSQ